MEPTASESVASIHDLPAVISTTLPQFPTVTHSYSTSSPAQQTMPESYSACSVDVAAALLAAKRAAQNVLASASSSDSNPQRPLVDLIHQTTEHLRKRQAQVSSSSDRYFNSQQNIPFSSDKFGSSDHNNARSIGLDSVSENTISVPYEDDSFDQQQQKPYSFIFEDKFIHRKTEIDNRKINLIGGLHLHRIDKVSQCIDNKVDYDDEMREYDDSCFLSQKDTRDITPPRPFISDENSDLESSYSPPPRPDLPFIDDADDEREITPPRPEPPRLFDAPFPSRSILPTILEDSPCRTDSSWSGSPNVFNPFIRSSSADNDESEIEFQNTTDSQSTSKCVI